MPSNNEDARNARFGMHVQRAEINNHHKAEKQRMRDKFRTLVRNMEKEHAALMAAPIASVGVSVDPQRLVRAVEELAAVQISPQVIPPRPDVLAACMKAHDTLRANIQGWAKGTRAEELNKSVFAVMESCFKAHRKLKGIAEEIKTENGELKRSNETSERDSFRELTVQQERVEGLEEQIARMNTALAALETSKGQEMEAKHRWAGEKRDLEREQERQASDAAATIQLLQDEVKALTGRLHESSETAKQDAQGWTGERNKLVLENKALELDRRHVDTSASTEWRDDMIKKLQEELRVANEGTLTAQDGAKCLESDLRNVRKELGHVKKGSEDAAGQHKEVVKRLRAQLERSEKEELRLKERIEKAEAARDTAANATGSIEWQISKDLVLRTKELAALKQGHEITKLEVREEREKVKKARKEHQKAREKKDEAIFALQTSVLDLEFKLKGNEQEGDHHNDIMWGQSQELRAEKLTLNRHAFEAREAAEYAEKHLKFQQKEVTRLVSEAKKTQESLDSRLASRKKAYEDALGNLRTSSTPAMSEVDDYLVLVGQQMDRVCASRADYAVRLARLEAAQEMKDLTTRMLENDVARLKLELHTEKTTSRL